MKKKLLVISFAVCMTLILAMSISVQANASSKQKKYQERTNGTWSNGENIIYGKNLVLYKKSKEGTEVIADFFTQNDDLDFCYLDIVSIHGNYVYIEKADDTFKTTAYSVNIKTGEKAKLGKTNSLELVCGAGKYIYGYNGHVGRSTSDDITLPANIYELKNGKLKRIKTLGKRIRGIAVYKGKLYYASYNTKSQATSRKMVVYSCKLNGKSKKKLFTMTSGNKNEWLRLGTVGKGKVYAKRWNPAEASEKYYVYSMKNKRLKKIKSKNYKEFYH